MKDILIALVIIFSIQACTEPFDIKLKDGDNQDLVVDAWLDNTDRDQIVRLGLTTNFFDDSGLNIATGADVRLTTDDFTYDFEELGNGRYRMIGSIIEDAGTLFTLRIAYQGTEYTASQVLNRLPAPEYTYRKELDPRPMYEHIYLFDITVQEPEGAGDYYFFNSFIHGTDPDLGFENASMVSDEYFDGALVEEQFVTRGYFAPGDTINVQMRSISEDAHDYMNIVLEQTEDRGGLFDTPPANVPTNISGGAKGFFILSGIEERQFVVD